MSDKTIFPNAAFFERWRAPLAIGAGGMIMFVSLGGRQGFGLFMLPLQTAGLFTREQFSAAIALQYLTWGLAAPFFGAWADRHGSTQLILAGAALYCGGFLLAGSTTSVTIFTLAVGALVGTGLAATSYGVINAAVGRAVPPRVQGRALMTVASIGALGQCLVLFLTNNAIHAWGARPALQAHGALIALIAPLGLLLAGVPKMTPPRGRAPAAANIGAAVVLASRDFRRLLFGFGCSGFQVMFVMTHLPAMTIGMHFTAGQASLALAVISCMSFLGTVLFGALAKSKDKRRLLQAIYFARALMAAAFPFLNFNLAGLLLFLAVLGLVWLSTFPVLTALIAETYGIDHVGRNFNMAFLAHQAGGFLGTWLAGFLFQQEGAYTSVWLLSAMLCFAGALLTTRGCRSGAHLTP